MRTGGGKKSAIFANIIYEWSLTIKDWLSDFGLISGQKAATESADNAASSNPELSFDGKGMKLNSESDAAEVVKAIKVLSPFKLNSHRSALRAFLPSIKIPSSRQLIFLALKSHEISNVVQLSVCPDRLDSLM